MLALTETLIAPGTDRRRLDIVGDVGAQRRDVLEAAAKSGFAARVDIGDRDRQEHRGEQHGNDR
jgi:hypothetical protein